MKPSPRIALPLLALSLAGCGEPAPTPDASSDAAVDARADASSDAPVADAGPGVAFAMAPGEVAEVPVAAGVAALRLATPTGTERFVLVLASTRFVEMDTPATYSVLPRVDGFAPTPTLVTGCSLDETRWRATTPTSEAPPTGAAPAIGAERTFRIPIATAAGVPEVLTARVVAVSERAVVWADVTAGRPATTLDMTFLAGMLRDFDATILPRERAVFGTESDVDGDGRVSLVFSPRVADTGGQGFFWQCDLLGMVGCSGNGGTESNRVEAVYLGPIDMSRPPYNTPGAVNEIVAHEVGHLVHFGRKVLRNRLTTWSDSAAMVEGLGGFAQDAIGFQLDALRATKVALDQVDRFSLAEVLSDGAEYDPARKAALRGGAYLFVRWLYDRAGGDAASADGSIASRGGPALLRALLDAPTSVASSLRTVAGLNQADLAVDFYTALAASNRETGGGVAASNACFRYGAVAMDPVTARPRGADLYSTFEGMMARGPATQVAAMADGALRHGGVEYLQVDAAAGAAELAVTVRADVSAAARVRVLRVR